MGGGVLAIRLQSYKHKDVVMEVGNSLAGGIFLSAGMVHMLPEASEALSESYPDTPMGPILCVAGMLLPLWVENVLVAGEDGGSGSGSHGHSHGGGGDGGDGAGHVHGMSFIMAVHEDDPVDAVDVEGGGVGGGAAAAAGGPSLFGSVVSSALVPYLIALLLGIHSLIEGIAIGVEHSEARASMILLAVLCHKGLAAFSLGVALTRAQVPLPRFLQVMTFFSLMTPLGGLLGALLSASVTSSLQGVLADLILAFASGTFLYVGLVEIILVEIQPSKPNVGLKFVTVVGGASLMTFLGIAMHTH